MCFRPVFRQPFRTDDFEGARKLMAEASQQARLKDRSQNPRLVVIRRKPRCRRTSLSTSRRLPKAFRTKMSWKTCHISLQCGHKHVWKSGTRGSRVAVSCHQRPTLHSREQSQETLPHSGSVVLNLNGRKRPSGSRPIPANRHVRLT